MTALDLKKRIEGQKLSADPKDRARAWVVAVVPKGKKCSSGLCTTAPFVLSEDNNQGSGSNVRDPDNSLRDWALGFFHEDGYVKTFTTVNSMVGSFNPLEMDDSKLFRAVLVTSKSTFPSSWAAVSPTHTKHFLSVQTLSFSLCLVSELSCIFFDLVQIS